ncbi:ABC transporter ATP-binding protein [Bradyrhizobium liaoningense]|uniref:ABC transporter ATP-binding protein n=1 Tax=Bradyrhizobium liaoningense TaxID=43992 RepID=UPI001BA77642|nr:ABC transporter ATP-binding protein [Bradyrhizobium liaoningense]MBR0740095.1 ABC transporter ATP-binding protein [Bradyrhizobium liaoningense]
MNQRTPSTVEIRNLRKEFGGTVAVDDLTLSVRKGEVLCLLGPSGCGKTTTLRMIAGFMEPEAGSILIDGRESTGLPPYRRDTGMVFQGYALFPHMTVEQNVAFGLVNINVPRKERDSRVAEMLELVELSHLAKRYPRQLSGGQQQRVALARALAIRPAVLLLDEPFSNLDTQLRVRLRDELKRLIAKIDVTTILVTHDQEEAVVFSDRIAVMNAGRLAQLGTPAEVYEMPANAFVANFIGECTLVEGQIKNDVFSSGRGLSFPLPGRDGKATLMIRPEHLSLGDGPGRLLAHVTSAVFTGGVTRLMLSVSGEELLMQSFFRHSRVPVQGDEVNVRIDTSCIHRLD